ncbi:hypothetical protein FBD94_15410 [Pedobacter hiemivivus]|uniref:DUF5977 domain-containing protein n=1 Tax=Pedobacter hiemivivus TaxID=2530454 RepID=A0A4U1G8X7_9SPHI|nr:DUF5977 domain-containing protein [Pedobacter hiemivivus]TKC60291.1 hypothetical protein FBD94_15410 [Pedobacter hiemivivus]
MTRTFRRQVKKTVCLILVFSILNQLATPIVAYALTSGPTAPEASSFEPVDTTDMVNLLTGDLAYSLPLLEVPGPEGGYPLSLSNHAGIQPNEDASWVGLGWTLNPGAINRNVSGYPDDWMASSASKRDYWEGGITVTRSFGVTVPIIGNVVSASFGLSFSNDTYKGNGVGWNLGVGVSLGKNSPLSLNATVGVTAYGQQPYVGIGLGVKVPIGNSSSNLSLNYGANYSTNFHTGGFGVSASVSYGKGMTSQSLVGVSGSLSSSSNPSISVGGYSSTLENSGSGGVRTSTRSTSVDLGIVSWGKEKTRYWSDETQSSHITGSLHPNYYYYTEIPDSEAYDSYSLQEEGTNVIDNPDPAKLQGGAYPAYDSYQVTAQGLGGSMRPFRFNGEAHSQNKIERIDNNTLVRAVGYISNSTATGPPEFRFEGDFSNNYLQDYPDYWTLDAGIIFSSPPNSGPQYEDSEWESGVSGNKVAGSRSINYYTTKWDGTVWDHDQPKSFITPVVHGLDRIAHTSQATFSTHIAGFSITNESGVTYHYNLPAYTYDEEIYQQKIKTDKGLYFSRQKKNEGYAYTWYLTAVTGPDYVDRGTIGKIDSQDYGYYVSFEYGKWSDKYSWRNPSEGSHTDDDANFNMVSMGKKEIYYLNAIRTRSHAAIFEKDLRIDGKSASPEIFEKNWSSNNSAETDYRNGGVFSTNSSQSLRLDKIYLLNSSDADLVYPSAGGNGNYIPSGRSVSCSNCELPNNIIDKNDVDVIGRGVLESKSIRIIDFNYDYHLTKGTVNSFDINNAASKSGKLSLNSIAYRGKGGASLLPPIKFSYDLDETSANKSSGSLNYPYYSTANGNYNIGDLLETADFGTQVFCGVIVSKSTSGSGYIYTLRNGNNTGNANRSVQKTKNPPYNKDFYDSWGMYKADYIASNNENLSRRTTHISNNATDVWSLKKVSTVLGAEVNINLEGDTYSRSVLNKNRSFVISNFTKQGSNNYYFDVNSLGQDLASIFKINDKLDFILLKEVKSLNGFPTYVKSNFLPISSDSYPDGPIITSISNNRIFFRVSQQMNTDILSSGGFPSVIRTGNLQSSGDSRYYGGGVRVKNITIDNLSGIKNINNYNYQYINDPVGLQRSSGVTSYEPITLEVDEAENIIVPSLAVPNAESNLKDYRRLLYRDMNHLLSISREVPSPGVMYEYVTTENSVINAEDNIERVGDGKTTFQFEVFRDNMVGRQNVSPPRSAPRSSTESYFTKNIVMKKFLSNIGALKRSVVYDKTGNKLKEIVNHYLHDGLELLPFSDFMTQYEQRLGEYQKQGLIKERYSEVKSVWTGSNNDHHIKATLSARETYPAIPIGQTIFDYVAGTTTSQNNLAFDFYSGAVTKSVSTDSYGNRMMSEMIPAYKKHRELGPKLYTGYSKNMLSQEAARYIYKVDAGNNKVGLVSASVGLWSNSVPVLDADGNQIVQNDLANGKVWRRSASYIWSPSGESQNGITALGNFIDFDWDNLNSQNSSWKKSFDVTLYDVYSKALEARDVNNQYAATRMGYNNSKAIVSASLARYDEIAYAGAEDPLLSNGKFSCNISTGAGVVVSSVAHSGNKSLSLSPGNQGFSYQVSRSKLDPISKDYQVSVWVKGSDVSNARIFYQIDGASPVFNNPVFNKSAAGWYLIEMRIPASAIAASNSNLTVGCKNIDGSENLYFDDIRFQPLNSVVQSYVYDTFSGELTYVLDNNNIYTKYEYDLMGRLVKTYREVLGKETIPLRHETVYNYGTMFKGNAEVSADFRKECGPGYMGSVVKYIVPAGRYSSSTQAGADAIAWADVNANGQNYANTGAGVCTQEIYVRAEVLNGYTSTYELDGWNVTETWKEAYIRFYQDYECTIPAVLSADMDFSTMITDIYSGDYNQVVYYDGPYQGYQGSSEISIGQLLTNSYSTNSSGTLNTYDRFFEVTSLTSSRYYALPTLQY